MKYGSINSGQAAGAYLAYSLIVKGKKWKKGRRLSAADVAQLNAAGVESVVAARLETGDVDENTAATQVAAVVVGEGHHATAANTGRVNIIADNDGILDYDVAAAHRLNAVSEHLTLATLPPYAPVVAGALVATIKIIPFAVSQKTLATIQQVPFQVRAFRHRRVGLIQTLLPHTPQTLTEKTRKVTAARLRTFGAEIVAEQRTPHEHDAVVAALQTMRTQDNPDVLLIAAAVAVSDARDGVLRAVAAVGGDIIRVGMPVDPGNLLFLAQWDNIPVVGLPGCAKSPKLNGFDWVLHRVFAGVTPSSQNIAAMGVGGLLSEIPSRPQPRQHHTAANVAAILLAAGESRRTGACNKLLYEWNGKPLLLHAVTTLRAARRAGILQKVVAVTGHEAEKTTTLLAADVINVVFNPDYASGMASSLQCALKTLEKLDDTTDAALVFLADMPEVTAEDIAALVDAFNRSRADIVIPTHRGKRGNPVLLSRSQFPRIMQLEGDVGARALFADAKTLTMETGDGVLLDLDAPAQFLPSDNVRRT